MILLWNILAWTNSACFHCANICREKFIIGFNYPCKLNSSKYISESETKNLKPMWKWFSTERPFIRWNKFQSNRPFDILSIKNKYDSGVKDRKQLSSFKLNSENILSSSRKTTFYPRAKNHGELTEGRMKTTKQLLVETDRPQQYWVEWQISQHKKIFINVRSF